MEDKQDTTPNSIDLQRKVFDEIMAEYKTAAKCKQPVHKDVRAAAMQYLREFPPNQLPAIPMAESQSGTLQKYGNLIKFPAKAS